MLEITFVLGNILSLSFTFLLILILGYLLLYNLAVFMRHIKALFFMLEITFVLGNILSLSFSLCFTDLFMFSVALFIIDSVALLGILSVALLFILSMALLFMLSFTLLFRYLC